MSAKAFFVVCVPPETPDGPGELFGPFNTREGAETDAGSATDCPNRHLVAFGVGSDRVRLSCSIQAIDAYDWYYEHPDQVPEACRHIFPRLSAPKGGL